MTDEELEAPDVPVAELDSREIALEPAKPVLRIVKGDATPEEVGALVAVVAALGDGGEPPRRRTPEWSAHHRKLRRSLPHGPGGWRSSGLPG